MKLTKRILSLFLCMVMILGMIPVIASAAEEVTATLTFDDTSKRTVFDTSHQVWVENGITVTNNKGSSKSNVANYFNPVRLYAGSEVIIALAEGNTITKIEVTCGSSSYATALKNSAGDEATASSSVVTIVPTAEANSYTVASLTAQVRIASMTVYYTAADEGGDSDDTVCEHTNLNAATHENGEHIVTCADCGEVQDTEYAISTTYTNADHTTACSCGEYTVTEAHTLSDWTVQTPATAAAPGEEIKTCSGCEYTESQEIPQLEITGNHYIKVTGDLVTGTYIMIAGNYAMGAYESNWVLPVVPPVVDANTVTDDMGGVWTLTVTDTGVMLTDANGVTVAPKAGNNNGIISGDYNWAWAYDETTGTYTFSGVDDDTTILACNTAATNGLNRFRSYKTSTVSDDTAGTYIAAFTLYRLETEMECNHAYTSEQTKAPTCTEAGELTYTCSTCGDSYTEEIATTGHSHNAVVTAPTCTAGGYTTYTCACGDSYTADETAATGHAWGEGVIDPEPTCEGAGVKTYTCGTCGATETEAVSAKGHTEAEEVIENNVAPTCTVGGSYDTVVYCAVCNAELSRVTTTVDAIGHNYTSEITTQPTYNTPGVETFTCSNCGDTYTESISATVTGLTGSGTVEDPYLINNLDELKWFRDDVNNGNRYNGKVVKLNADIDLGDEEWTPIGDRNVDQGSFLGTFDGANHTISNLWISEWTKTGAGFFSKVGLQSENVTGAVKNVTFNNVTILSTQSYVGLIAQAPSGALIENVKITGEVTIQGYGYVGGIVGHGYPTMDNCSVVAEGCIISNYWGVGAILGFSGDYGSKVTNSTVIGTGDGLLIHGNYGGAAAVTGSPYGAAVDGAYVENVTITSNSDYCMGYVAAGGTVTNATVTNVTATASGGPITPADAVATIGNNVYFSLPEAFEAAVDGDTVELLADVELSEKIVVSKKSITFDGNGHKITQAEGMTLADYGAALRFDGTSSDISAYTYTVKDVVFDGWNTRSVLAIHQCTATVDNVTIQNGKWDKAAQAMSYGLLYLENTEITVKNSTFTNNDAEFVVTYNYGSPDSTAKLVIDECVFSGNTVGLNAAAVYYVTGSRCTITNSEFVGNNVTTGGNGATLYLGFMENCTVTGCLFKDNTVHSTGTSTRVAGAIFFGYEADISNNAFVNNTASNADGATLGQVCTSTYYDCEIDLSGNYWGDNQPVAGKDYTIQHQTGDASFALDNYYTVWETDENGNVVLSNLVDITYVASVGKYSYTSLQDAINAAGAGDTVTLLSDIALTESVTVSADKVITLDLNGKTVSMEDASAAACYMIKNYGTLTIKDSSAEQTGKLTFNSTTPSANNGYSVSTIGNGGNLIVESGIIENTTNGSAAYAIDTLWYSSDVSVTVNGGTVKAGRIAIRQVPYSTTAKNTLNINGGTITGGTAAAQTFNFSSVAALADVNISGGTLNGSYAYYTSYTSAGIHAGTDIEISGGIFNGYVFIYNGNAGSNVADFANVAITNGTFNSGVYVYTKDAEENEVSIGAISGGIFAEDATAYCVEGYHTVANDEGKYIPDTHQYEAVVTAPTCTAGGYTTYTCDCGDSYTDDEVAALGHSYTSEITKQPTAGEEGVETFTCSNCGDTYTKPIAKLEGVAEFDGKMYDTVQEALDAAQNGGTVTLWANAELNALMLMPGMTLDLNGYTVEAVYVVGFKGSNVIDSSEANAGLLKVAQDRVMLDLNNSQLPVYNNELGGYLFLEINIKTQLEEDTKNDVATFKFFIFKDADYLLLLDLVKDGAADNNLSVMVKLTWTTAEGNSASQYYAYSESVIMQTTASHLNSKYGVYTCVLNGINSRESISYAAVLQSGTSTELTFAA